MYQQKADALVVGFRRWLIKYGGAQVDWGTNLLVTCNQLLLGNNFWTGVYIAR